MKRVLLHLGIVFCMTVSLAAQQPAEQRPTAPSGPLLKNAPDFAQWVLTSKGGKAASGDAGAPQAVDSSAYQTTVKKTKPVYHVVTTNHDGKKEVWCLEELQLASVPNAQLPIISTSGNRGAHYLDFSKKDFFGFDWISANNFVEVKNIGGVDCLIFQGRSKNEFGEEADARAVINAGTRLPISLQVGDRITTYEFQAAPAAMLAPPEEIAAIVKQWRERSKRAKAMPSS